MTRQKWTKISAQNVDGFETLEGDLARFYQQRRWVEQDYIS